MIPEFSRKSTFPTEFKEVIFSHKIMKQTQKHSAAFCVCFGVRQDLSKTCRRLCRTFGDLQLQACSSRQYWASLRAPARRSLGKRQAGRNRSCRSALETAALYPAGAWVFAKGKPSSGFSRCSSSCKKSCFVSSRSQHFRRPESISFHYNYYGQLSFRAQLVFLKYQ